jgi:hypothetical protein
MQRSNFGPIQVEDQFLTPVETFFAQQDLVSNPWDTFPEYRGPVLNLYRDLLSMLRPSFEPQYNFLGMPRLSFEPLSRLFFVQNPVSNPRMPRPSFES